MATLTLTYLEAARQALAQEMRRDPLVWAVGEDLGRGGVSGQYRGLVDEFGPARIADAPISESCIMGASVGAAMMGTRPVVELRFTDFAACAMDEIINQAAKARFMFGGQARVPLVVRAPMGMKHSAAAQHSQSLEAWFAHIPGLVVVTPATPADMMALLKAAIRCDDPVMFLEHKDLWGLSGEVDDEAVAELGQAGIVRTGDDLTLLSWSRSVHDCLTAAVQLAEKHGISAEVIDLRSLWPWDKDTVLRSVQRTRRLLVVHEAVQVGGFGAEIVATVTQQLFGQLLAPPLRLGAPRIPVSYSPVLEAVARVSVDRIVATALSLQSTGSHS